MRAKNKPGNYLLSQSLARLVPSALEGLTTEFGMGSGVAPPVWSPGNLSNRLSRERQLHCFAKKNKVVKPHGRLVRLS